VILLRQDPKYTKEGEFVSSIGSTGTEPGQFQGPAGVAISPVSGNFFVTDQYNNCVQVPHPEGEPILTFGETGSGPGQFNLPIDLEVDEFENIYVVDSVNGRIQIFDKTVSSSRNLARMALHHLSNLVRHHLMATLDHTPGTFNWLAHTTTQRQRALCMAISSKVVSRC